MPMPRPALALTAALALAACGSGGRVPASNPPAGTPVSAAVAPLSTSSVAPGQSVAFGAVASVCDLPESRLGAPIAQSAGFALHDSAPGSTEPRTHWITGFSDGCPRQVTAALALFGDVAMHESFRYGSREAYDATDAAYESVKARVCGVPQGQPCGAALNRLAADTVFVSLYPAFGAEEHSDLLLHAGELIAADG
jgi:hypothetical protein